MIELCFPQVGEDAKNVKDIVFVILASEQPLSLIELSNRAHERYNLRATYQGVRKAINNLQSQGIIEKEGKKYRIKKGWILDTKSFIDKLLLTYETGKGTNTFTPHIGKEDYAVYTFNNLLDLDNFWNDVMEYWVRHLKPGDNKDVLCYSHYAWWMIINIGQETALMNLFAKKTHPKFAFFEDSPLNNWAATIYKNAGWKTTIRENKEVDPTLGVNALGDMIIQVKYPIEIINKIRKIFQKSKTIQDISPSEIAKIAHTPCEIKFVVFRNQTIAKSIAETNEKYF